MTEPIGREALKKRLVSIIAAMGVSHHDKQVQRLEDACGGYVMVNAHATADAVLKAIFAATLPSPVAEAITRIKNALEKAELSPPAFGELRNSIRDLVEIVEVTNDGC